MLTTNQQLALDELTAIGRRNAVRWRGRCEHLYQDDLGKLQRGDQACVFGMGGLTWQVGSRTGMKAGAVLSIFKALERKGLILREKPRGYQCALYWWPIGLAAKLAEELTPRC